MENNEAFVGGDNTNQRDGLNGLGAVCNKSMCFEPSTFETPETNSD